jgi:DHA1 family tetracycline resistance protein-like MFS transporter
MAPTNERRALAVVLSALLIDTIGFGIIIPVMPDLIVGLTHTSLGEAARRSGWLMGVFAAMQFLFGPVMGGLGDRFGRRPVIILCMLTFGLDYLVMGLAPTFGWLFVSRAVAGISGATFVPASAYIADITPPERRAQSFGLIGAAFGLGFTIGPAIGGLLGGFGTRAPFFVAAGLALINAMCGLFLLPESLPPERRRAFQIKRANPFGTFASLARHHGAMPLFAAWFLWMLAHQSYPSTWAFFTKLKFGWSDHAVGASLAYAGFTLALAQAFVTRRLIPAIGERRAILLGLGIGLVGFLGNALVPQGWMVYLVLSVAALQGLVYPSMNSTLSRSVAANEQGELQGGVASLQSVSAIVGPPVLTGVLARFTREGATVRFPGAAFAVAAALTACAFVIVAFLARKIFARSAAAWQASAAAAATSEAVSTEGSASAGTRVTGSRSVPSANPP